MLLGFTFIIVSWDQVCGNQKVNVSVYYETLCWQSVRLIQRQLYPVWLDFTENLNISFVPYGKAVYNRNEKGLYSFECQHGPQECLGNRIQACALRELKGDEIKTMNYIKCFMSYDNFYSYNTTTCFEDIVGIKNNRSKTNFDECVNSMKGDELLAYYGDITYSVNPSITSVPALTFNGTFDFHLQDLSERDFRSVVCNLLHPAPAACT